MARLEKPPDANQLKTIVERAIPAVAGATVEVSSLSLHSFRPAYPKPKHRIGQIVQP
jgi:hypothetical protein